MLVTERKQQRLPIQGHHSRPPSHSPNHKPHTFFAMASVELNNRQIVLVQ